MCFPPAIHKQFKHQGFACLERKLQKWSTEHVSEKHCARSHSLRCSSAANTAQVVQDSSGKLAVLCAMSEGLALPTLDE